MYSNIENTDDDVFASAMEDAEIIDNPFVQGDLDGEPLHASDAASRLLDNYENEMSSMNSSAPAGAVPPSSNPTMGNSSLLERIQQQKRQQQTTSTGTAAAATEMTGSTTAVSSTDHDFGYPMVQEGSYSTSAGASATATGGVHVPQYSQVPGPNPYNTQSAYNSGSASASASGSIDYKDKFMTVLSVVGSAAGTVAKGAYQGGKVVYAKMTSNNNSNAQGVGGEAGAGMTELDYQRESLLMDPHDLESSTTAMNFGIGSSSANNTSTETTPSGMRAGIISGGNTSAGNDNSVLTFLKQFAVDMKDLFLSASPRVQIGIILLIVFIIWLIFFE